MCSLTCILHVTIHLKTFFTGKLHDFDTVCIFVNDSDFIISLRCNLTEPKLCTVQSDRGIISNNIKGIKYCGVEKVYLDSL